MQPRDRLQKDMNTVTFESRLKRLVLEEMLGEYGRALIAVRSSGCILPAECADDTTVLDLWPAAPVPIRDLELDDDGLSVTLSFNRTPFHCVIPWVAVRAIGRHGEVTLTLMEGESDPSTGTRPPPARGTGLKLVRKDEG